MYELYNGIEVTQDLDSLALVIKIVSYFSFFCPHFLFQGTKTDWCGNLFNDWSICVVYIIAEGGFMYFLLVQE